MRPLSLKSKLIVAIAALFLASASSSVVGYLKTTEILTKNTEVASKSFPNVQITEEIAASLGDVKLAYLKHILAVDDVGREKALAQIGATNEVFQNKLATYKAAAQTDAERVLIDKIVSSYNGFQEMGREVIDFSDNGMKAAASKYADEKMMPAGAAISGAVNEIIDLTKTSAENSFQQARQYATEATIVSVVAGLLMTVIAVGAMGLAIFGIARPIGRITEAMRRLADGQTDLVIPYAGKHDEIGAMAGSVEVFRQAALRNRELEREAEEARSRSEIERQLAEQHAEAEAAERLQKATAGLAEGLKRLAMGDMGFKLEEAFSPEFEPLRHDFNISITQLGATLSALMGSITVIDSSSREISGGAKDLSQRTEHQAASLEETAAALDQITVNVSNSSRRSEEAQKVAVEANRSAEDSARIVSHAEEAMRRIEASSDQISGIIGVIDEIAFQTNLLALNAGVEAARAGEAGKGFAVVAQEVRELAQRSARAAKEIKGLIQNSSNEVNGGVTLVRDAGQALGTIVSFIGEINQHMHAIATSSREQATGLAEVNAAVNGMDQLTQQNAFMVQQSHAASTSLAEEATKLRDLVARFRLPMEDSRGFQSNARVRTMERLAG
ncbi:methyl-accepting chemotaxis protein [Rhizobium alvei]|uniref:HAMP domain-containing methyl-accepting chemotaxis protein n=1 Tax=Rhizobium alvei TaxID=1132659 RepID=A0ABT8YUB2_9HYPH|nr:HAMP domain-containing methyl-accepting chemotaxis protein [Rhizobium alvei]MDO6966893.1 HAMP domain-containing methyl-accepting chemotaxis protein [Rhizobium alvei]